MMVNRGLLRLTLLVVVPVTALILLAYTLISTEHEEQKLAADISRNTLFYEKVSDVLMQLQRERGRSVLFLNGVETADQLMVQRQETDRTVKACERLFSESAVWKELSDKVAGTLTPLVEYRTDVDLRRSTPDQVIERYRSVVHALIMLQKGAMRGERSQQWTTSLNTLLWLELMREQAGLLRAQGVKSLSAASAGVDVSFGQLLGNSTAAPLQRDMGDILLDADCRIEFFKRFEKPEWRQARQVLEALVDGSFRNSPPVDASRFYSLVTNMIDDFDALIISELKHLRELETENFQSAGTRISRVKKLVWLVLLTMLIMGVLFRRQWLQEAEVERRIREVDAQQKLILGAAGEGIFGLNPDGTFSFANPSALAMLGYSYSELIGQPSHALIHHHHADGAEYSQEECPIYQAWRDGTVRHRDTDVFWRRDGTSFEVEYVSTPIQDGEVMKGAVIVFSDISTKRNLERELRTTLQQLQQAQDAEYRIGFQIQETLLFGNPPPEMRDLRVASLVLPARGVDGDFFNFVRVDDDVLDVMVGDVMGKGIAAALVAAEVKSQFQLALAEAGTRDGPPSPQALVTRVCRKMYQPLSRVNRFVCLHYARIHRRHKRLVVVNCGHTPLVHYRVGTGQCRQILPGNPPLGTEEDKSFQETSLTFGAGDLLIFFSDGITEARDQERRMFGIERLLELIQQHAMKGADAVVAAIHDAVQQHTGAAPIQDDITCVVIESRRSPDNS